MKTCTNPKCENYGKGLLSDAKFCGKCGEMVKDIIEQGGSSGTYRGGESNGGGNRGANKMPDGITLGTDEILVRKYRIGRYSLWSGFIDVIITNKRVIRYEESSIFGMQNNTIDDINIDSIHGNYTRMHRSISILGLISSVILFIVGLVVLLNKSEWHSKSTLEYIIGFAALLLTAIIIISSLKPSLKFGILGAVGSTEALVTEVNQRGKLFRRDNSAVFQFKPTPETTVMLKEIGACIYDIKTLGDAAIGKWQSKDSYESD